jgi:hypothetical protein
MTHGIYLARCEVRVTVTPDGVLRSVNTMNKSYGPRDIDPRNTRVEVREGQLSAEQVGELAKMFDGFDAFSSEPYPGNPDGGVVMVRYGDKVVRGGNGVPEAVKAIRERLIQLGGQMPVVKPS